MISNVQWWCSARGRAWTWGWQAYPGIWLAVLATGYWVRSRLRSGRPSTARVVASAVGVLLLWATLDWPAGPLGTGYLASVHALQFISLATIVPPLLLFAVVPGEPENGDPQMHQTTRAAALATQPVLVAVVFTVVMFATHAPRVVDGLMRFQAGAFLLDAAWFTAGMLFWWPVVVQRPERAWFTPLVRMLYVFFGTQAHLLIAMWLLLAPFPVYATYELAPRVTRLSALDDQGVAGGLMITLAEPLILGVISVIFFHWSRTCEEHEREQPRMSTGHMATSDVST